MRLALIGGSTRICGYQKGGACSYSSVVVFNRLAIIKQVQFSHNITIITRGADVRVCKLLRRPEL